MRVLLSHSDNRTFEVERFGAAWERCGGARRELLPVTPATAAHVLGPVSADVAGLLLTGGPDVEPRRFGAAPLEGVELRTDPARDALDLALLHCAEREGWPVLALCYGCQILNVFYGGTLIQDLERAGKPGHRIGEPKDHLTHVARQTGSGRLMAGLPREFAVNSRHHQAIERVAPGLEAVAVAPDGVVEAVEARDGSRFVLGVQWHPENLAQEPHVAIFRAFRAACLARAARSSPREGGGTHPGPRTPVPGL